MDFKTYLENEEFLAELFGFGGNPDDKSFNRAQQAIQDLAARNANKPMPTPNGRPTTVGRMLGAIDKELGRMRGFVKYGWFGNTSPQNAGPNPYTGQQPQQGNRPQQGNPTGRPQSGPWQQPQPAPQAQPQAQQTPQPQAQRPMPQPAPQAQPQAQQTPQPQAQRSGGTPQFVQLRYRPITDLLNHLSAKRRVGTHDARQLKAEKLLQALKDYSMRANTKNMPWSKFEQLARQSGVDPQKLYSKIAA